MASPPPLCCASCSLWPAWTLVRAALRGAAVVLAPCMHDAIWRSKDKPFRCSCGTLASPAPEPPHNLAHPCKLPSLPAVERFEPVLLLFAAILLVSSAKLLL